MSAYTSREVIPYRLPLAESAVILHPDKAILAFGNTNFIDVGALCYKDRAGNKSEKGIEPGMRCRYVNKASLDPVRTIQIRLLINYLSDLSALNLFKDLTLKFRVNNFINFIDWCDSNKHGGVLEDSFQAKSAFSDFVGYLREKLRNQEYKSAPLINYQSAVIKILSGFHDIDNLHSGLNIVRMEKDSEPTTPPDENDVSRVISLCNAIFKGFIDLGIGSECAFHLKRAVNQQNAIIGQ